jgi:hypothetical protein
VDRQEIGEEMITLTYGLKNPQTGDKGTTLWNALNANIVQLDAHTHDGVTSPHIPIQNVSSTTQSILAAAWVANGPTGFYRQAVSIPAGFTFDGFTIDFRTSAGKKVYPTVEKIDNTSYYVYTIDNTLVLTAVYGI